MADPLRPRPVEQPPPVRLPSAPHGRVPAVHTPGCGPARRFFDHGAGPSRPTAVPPGTPGRMPTGWSAAGRGARKPGAEAGRGSGVRKRGASLGPLLPRAPSGQPAPRASRPRRARPSAAMPPPFPGRRSRGRPRRSPARPHRCDDRTGLCHTSLTAGPCRPLADSRPGPPSRSASARFSPGQGALTRSGSWSHPWPRAPLPDAALPVRARSPCSLLSFADLATGLRTSPRNTVPTPGTRASTGTAAGPCPPQVPAARARAACRFPAGVCAARGRPRTR